MLELAVAIVARLALDSTLQQSEPQPVTDQLSQDQLFSIRHDAANLYLDPRLNDYIVDLVQASRKPDAFDAGLTRWCRFGASPRATLALARCARARAWLDGDDFVAPQHIQAIAPMRNHLLRRGWIEGEAEGVTTDDYISRLLEVVAIP